jgi:hypothetical protein
MRKNKKREGKLFSTSLPSLYRKCNADLDYESVTDAPDWIVKVPFLLIRCTFSRGVNISPGMNHCQLKTIIIFFILMYLDYQENLPKVGTSLFHHPSLMVS